MKINFFSLIVLLSGVWNYLPIGLINVRKPSVSGNVLALLTIVLGVSVLSGISEMWIFLMLGFWMFALLLRGISWKSEISNTMKELSHTPVRHILLKTPLKERWYFILWLVFVICILCRLLIVVRAL